MAKLVSDKPVKLVDLGENLGIHFDNSGNCIPHSILGPVEDYLQDAIVNGNSIVIAILISI